MVVHGNPAPRRRRHDDDARPSWSSLSFVGIVGVRAVCVGCGVVVVCCFVESVVVSFSVAVACVHELRM